MYTVLLYAEIGYFDNNWLFYRDCKANTPTFRWVMKPTRWAAIHQANGCAEFLTETFK
jgi:hypothetical protein